MAKKKKNNIVSFNNNDTGESGLISTNNKSNNNGRVVSVNDHATGRSELIAPIKKKNTVLSQTDLNNINTIKNNINKKILQNSTQKSFQNDIKNKTSNLSGQLNQQSTQNSTPVHWKKDDYQDTGKKYGDYYYNNYSAYKDAPIYKKDNKYYTLYNGKYEELGTGITKSSMMSKEDDKKQLEEAKKLGYKEQKLDKTKEYIQAQKTFKKLKKDYKLTDEELNTFIKSGKLSLDHVPIQTNDMSSTRNQATKYRELLSDGKIKKYDSNSALRVDQRLELDTNNLNDKQYKEFKEDLKRQNIKDSKISGNDVNYGYDGSLKGTIQALGGTANKIKKSVTENIINPANNIKDIYDYGKKQNKVSLEYYKKMEGKDNNASQEQNDLELYEKFNKDIVNDNSMGATAIKNANTQIESLKNQGVIATGLGLVGATVGTLINPGTGTLKGAKIGASVGYTVGSTPYTYKLEAGNEYKSLKDLGVPDDIAKKHSRRVGGINALIESGENIIDLFTFKSSNQVKAIPKETVSELVDDYGENQVRKWLKKNIGIDATDTLLTSLKSYKQNIISEGVEEMTQEGSSITGERLATKESNIDRKTTIKEDLKRVGEAGISAAMSTALTSPISSLGGAITNNTINNISNKIDNKNYSNFEKDVIENETNRIIKKQEEKQELTSKEKKEIYNQVKNDLKNGNISIDTIEKTIGGEDYKKYKNATDKYTKIQNKIDKLESIKMSDLSVKEYNENQTEISKLKEEQDKLGIQNLRSNLTQTMIGKIDSSSSLQNVYLEENKKYEKYSPDLSKYNEKEQKVVQSAIDSELLNNTSKTHSFVDLVAKISSDKGVDFKFSDNKTLEESGFSIKDRTINGFIDGNTITLNTDSSKPLNQVVGHEITHVLENSKLYDSLKQLIKDYATTKGEYNSRLSEISKTYEDVKSADVEKELTSDLVGEYLFTDEEFVKHLSTNKRNIFQKIYDEIKYLCKVVTAGSREARQLLKVKKTFDKVYINSENNISNDTKLSINRTDIIQDYPEQYKKNILLNKNNIILNDINEIDYYVDQAFEKKGLDNILHFGMLKKEIVDKIKESIENFPKNGWDLKKNVYEIAIRQDTFLHLGDHKTRITKEDVKEFARRLPDIIAKFDKVVYSNNTKNEGLKFYKNYDDGMYLSFMLTSNKKNRFMIKSIYMDKRDYETKKRNISPKANENSLAKTSETNGAFASLHDNVPQNNKNVKYSTPTYSISNINENNTKDLKELNNSSLNETTTDSKGRTLTKEQQNYFKDSKVRDENDNLKVVYHGTPNNFTVFNYDKLGTNGTLLGKGFYLTDDINVGTAYANKGTNGKIMEVYANITKPLKWGETSISKYEYKKFVEAINEATNGQLIADYSGEYTEKGSRLYNATLNDILMDYEYGGDDIDLVSEIINTTGMNWGDAYKILTDTTGYDGIIVTTDVYDSGEGNVYIPFQSNQIKNIDNTNPTDNEDIRHSLTQKNNISPYNERMLLKKDKNEKNYFTKNETPLENIINENIEKNNLGYIPKDPTKEETYDYKEDKTTQKRKTIENKIEKMIQNKNFKAITGATKVAKNYIDFDYNEKIEFKNQLMKFKNYTRDELINSKTYNEVRDILLNYANREMKFVDEDLKDVKKEIRKIKIKVDEDLKNQITDYKYFRKANFGSLRLSKEGISVDSLWQDLNNTYPYYFDSSVNTKADMLEELSNFMAKDNEIVEKYMIPAEDIEKATIKVYNSLMNNTITKEEINELQKYLESKQEARTRKVVREELLNEMGITIDDISKGKDIMAIDFQRTDPIRLHEKVFGYEVGKKINDATVNKTKHNEAERNRYLNKVRQIVKDLGIKARSKESAAVQKYAEKKYINDNNEYVKYGDDELEREFPNKETQKKIKIAARTFRNLYDEILPQINGVLEDMGYTPIPKRDNYMPHFQAFNDVLSKIGFPVNAETMSQDSLPTDINGITDQFKPGKNFFVNAMQRVGIKTEYDAISGFDRYIEGASNLIYHTEDIQRYRALGILIRDTYGTEHGFENLESMSDAETIQRIEDIKKNKLSKYAAWIDEQANAIAGKKGTIDRSAERFFGRKIYNILDSAKKQVGSNMTGFNVRSSLTNFASAIQGASKTNKLAFIKGTISTVRNIVHKDNLIDKSDFLTNRLNASESLSKKIWQKVSNAGQIFMTGSDYFTANQIWRSKYFENLYKGMNETEAIKNADDFSAKIMGDRSKGSTAEIFNSKSLGLLTQFQLEVNNQWSSIIHDNKMDIQSGNKSGAMVVFQLGQLATMSFMFNNLMKAVTGSDVMFDPIDILKNLFEDDEEKEKNEKMDEILDNIVDNLPFSQMISLFTEFGNGGRIPVTEAFNAINTSQKYLFGKEDKYGNKIDKEDVKNDLIKSSFYWLLPTGFSQLNKTYKGLSMYKNEIPGSYTDSGKLRFEADNTPMGIAQAALFGQYASKQARYYVDSGFKTISESDNKLMKQLDINKKQFDEIKNDISKLKKNTDDNGYIRYIDKNKNIYWYDKKNNKLYDKNYEKSNKLVISLDRPNTKEEVMNYISNLKMSDKKKNILLNNIYGNNDSNKYGLQKYIETYYDATKGKNEEEIYWYDKNSKKLYDNNYKEVEDVNVKQLDKVEDEKYDIKEYKKYGTYEEFDFYNNNKEKYKFLKDNDISYKKYKKNKKTYDWAYNNQGEYVIAKTINKDISVYQGYKNRINSIKSDKNSRGNAISGSRKRKVVSYVNSLPLNITQKALLIKQEYKNYNDYNQQINNYLNSLNYSQKEEIKRKLGL